MIFKTKSRAAELSASLRSTEQDLAEARASLGNAVTDGDEPAAASSWTEIARLEQLAIGLREALPIAEQRISDAADREAKRNRDDQEKALNAARKKRIAAARKVDKALRALGSAYSTFEALPTGGTNENAIRVKRRATWSICSAIFRHAPILAQRLGIERIPRYHWASMADAESGMIGEFPDVE